MTPVCDCGRMMDVEQNGVYVEEICSDGMPYRIWSGDRWRCPECGTGVVTGFGHEPLAESYQDRYAAIQANLKPTPARHGDAAAEVVAPREGEPR